MKKFNVELQVDDFILKAKLNHKINVIQGPSGCGKSYITLRMSRMELEPIVIVSESNVNVIESYPKNSILWFDEDVTLYIKRKDKFALINNSNYRCIFISRDVLKGITYSYKSVYRMDFDESKHEYSLNSYYPDYAVECKGNSFVTEDTKAGNYYYSHHLPNVRCPQQHEDMVDLAKQNDSTLIADGIAFGFQIKRALQKDVNLFLPESFEYLIGSKLFSKEKMFDYDVQDMITHNHTTEEKCVTRHFIEECRELDPPINYDKTIESIKDTIIMKTNVFAKSHEEVLREYYKAHNLEFETQVKRDAESFGERSCQIHNVAINDIVERAYQANKLLGNI